MKAIINQSEFLQLLGLLTVARKYQKIVDQADLAMSEIVGSDEKYTLLSDIIYDDSDLKETLANMHIEVTDLQPSDQDTNKRQAKAQ